MDYRDKISYGELMSDILGMVSLTHTLNSKLILVMKLVMLCPINRLDTRDMTCDLESWPVFLCKENVNGQL